MPKKSTAKKKSTSKRAKAKSATKQVAPSKPSKKAAKKAAKKKVAQKVAKKSSRKAAAKVVRAKVDVGWGNTLYVRGDKAGLSWEKGIPMTNVSSGEWTWTPSGNEGAFEFKLLVNDVSWSVGHNFHGNTNKAVVVSPLF